MANKMEKTGQSMADDLPRVCTPGEVRELFMKYTKCGWNTYYKCYHPFFTFRKIHDGQPVIPLSEVKRYIRFAIENPKEKFRYVDRKN